jgi:DNA ligase-1
MLAHAIEDTDFAALDPADYIAEWKWDGIRVQAVAGRDERGQITARLYSRTGEDITGSFPDLVPSLRLAGAIDGELLILREGRVQSFNVLQQRLNRKVVSPKLIKEFPIHLRAYDLLGDDENDLRELPFAERRERLETFIGKLDDPRIDLSPTVPFASWQALTAARADPASAGAGEDADAVEGVMLKRRDAPYLPGRPKGQWWKWKRDPHIIDAVLMYAQRGHGKRSSYYSDYTFGVWTRSEKPILASPTRSSCRSTVSSAATPPRNSAPCATSCTSATRGWCWRWRSRGCSVPRGTNPASPCAFPASAGCAGTSRRARQTGWKRWKRC